MIKHCYPSNLTLTQVLSAVNQRAIWEAKRNIAIKTAHRRARLYGKTFFVLMLGSRTDQKFLVTEYDDKDSRGWVASPTGDVWYTHSACTDSPAHSAICHEFWDGQSIL